MKRFSILLLALVALTAFTSLASADARGARIRHGIASGRLTPGETARLRAGQVRVRHLQRRAWADGGVSARERAVIHRAKSHHSRAIYRLKHNGRGC